MSQQDTLATVAKSPSGQVILLHHIKSEQADPLSENPRELKYAIQGVEDDTQAVFIISDIFEKKEVDAVNLTDIADCQTLEELRDIKKEGLGRIWIRATQVVPPTILKEWQNNGIEEKSAKTLLFELLSFAEMHDQGQPVEGRITPKLQPLIQWLYHCATDEHWLIIITDSAIPKKIKTWKKALEMMHLDHNGTSNNTTTNNPQPQDIAGELSKILDKDKSEKTKKQGWKKLAENIKNLYINITFDGENQPTEPAKELLDLLSQGNSQNLKVYLHFLFSTESCNMYIQPALSAIIYYGFLISQSVTAPDGLTPFLTPPLNPKIHQQDPQSAMKASLDRGRKGIII